MSKPPESPGKNRNTLRNVALLSGIAVEMGVIIYLSARGGMWLDAHFGTEKRLFTAFCTLVGVGISLWVVLRQIRRIQT